MIRHFAYSILSVIVALVVALFWTLELPQTPPAPVTTHIAVVPVVFGQ